MIIHKISKNDKKTYSSQDFDIKIFDDDTIEKALVKIAFAIAHIENDSDLAQYIPYAWTKSECIRFNNFQLSINPWEQSIKPPSKVLINYNNNKLIGPIRTLYITFWKDADFSNKEHYFPDVPNYSLTSYNYDNLVKDSGKLARIFADDFVISPTSLIHSKIRYAASVNVDNIDALFNSVTSSQLVPLIQCSYDSYNIKYKLFKRHRIPVNVLTYMLTYRQKPESVSFSFSSSEKNIFAIAMVTAKAITLNYNFDTRDKIQRKFIDSHLNLVTQYFQNVFKTKIVFKPISVSAKIDIKNISKTLPDIARIMRNLPDVFYISKIQDDVIYAIYKRSDNYTTNVDIDDYILSGVQLGMSMDEIRRDLIELGTSKVDADLWIEQYQNMVDNPDGIITKKPISINSCLIKISKSSFGFNISIENVATFLELEKSIKWIAGILNTEFKKPVTPPIAKPVKKPIVVVPPPEAKIESEEEHKFDYGNMDDLDFDGGAGVDISRYFLSLLQQNDPKLFLDVREYPRKCGANNFRQPLVLNKEEFGNLDKNTLDNFIVYGSDTNNINYYTCPRIWCPVSRVSLTEEQKNKFGCPMKEDPIITYKNNYWDNDPNIKHYMTFLKKRNDSGLCLPCCGIKAPNKDFIASCSTHLTTNEPKKLEQQPEMKDDNYIINTSAPINPGRYGTIPEDLHNLLMPDIAYQLCSKTLSSQPCYVRKGILHGSDSIMNAISSLLGFSNKIEFVKDIKKHLNPLLFISLADGHVLQAFSANESIIPTKSNVDKWKKWSSNFRNYTKLIDTKTELQLSRELGIYKAYENFIEHLESPDIKNPSHICALVAAIYNILPLIFKRKESQISLKCPMFDGLTDLAYVKENNFFIIIEEEGYYEPVELKARSKNAIETISNNVPLSNLIQQCPIKTNDIVERVRGLVLWTTRYSLIQPKPFVITTVVLRQDMRIYGFITSGNILILAPVRGIHVNYLAEFIVTFGLSKIIYLEDLQDTEFVIKNVFIQDYQLFAGKLERLGFEILKVVPEFNGSFLSAKWSFPSLDKTILPLILTQGSDFHNEISHIINKNKEWYNVQYTIGKWILRNYENLDITRLNKIAKKITSAFTKIDKNKLLIILAEIPLKDGRKAIEQWVRTIGLERRSDISIHPISNKNEWLFTQAAVSEGLPLDVLQPGRAPQAKEIINDPTILDFNEKNVATKNILQFSNSLEDSLPSKFTQIKNYSWKTFKIRNAKFIDIMNWMSVELRIPITLNDILRGRLLTIEVLLRSKSDSTLIFDDPALFNAWCEIFKKKFQGGFDDLWKAIVLKPYEERIKIWREMAANLPTMEIDVYMLSQLLDVNIMILHRSKNTHDTKKIKRGTTEDLATSSVFFRSPSSTSYSKFIQRPVCIFYKEITKTEAVFHPIVDKDGVFLHNN
ncbi:hypothetical protein EBV26_16990, partial [bacterium]|nr:hypothetical protein [bacterium]